MFGNHRLPVNGLSTASVQQRSAINNRNEQEGAMKEPGLDNRHRDKDGEISRKHGNTLVRTLRKIYGAGFAPGFNDSDKLGDVLRKFNEPTLTQLRRDHDTGSLVQKISRNAQTMGSKTAL
jgi:hypothetical protein